MNPISMLLLASFWSPALLGRLASQSSSGGAALSWSTPIRASRTTEEGSGVLRGNLTVLAQDQHHVVVAKPPSVVCHHSEWTGSRARQEVPMLQRVREAVGGRRVNLVHRLDRGCSGCLLLTFAQGKEEDDGHQEDATRILNDAMQAPSTVKTYLALVRGEGILHGRDFRQEGWFTIDRPIKSERGTLHNATTSFRFVAGQDNDRGRLDRPRAALVLARPSTGRWHQIRKHLNGLSHPILGDSTHGISKVNREFKARYGMLPERTCLHLCSIQMEATSVTPAGILAQCPLAPDMLQMLRDHMPDLLAAATPILQQEGVWLEAPPAATSVVLPYEVVS
jgi:tRNA pseudouridine65 synthase